MESDAQNLDDFDLSRVKIERAPTPIEDVDDEPLIRRRPQLARKVKKTKPPSDKNIKEDEVIIKEEQTIKEEPSSPVPFEQNLNIAIQEMFQSSKDRGLWEVLSFIKTEADIKKEKEEDEPDATSTSKEVPQPIASEDVLSNIENSCSDLHGQESEVTYEQRSSELGQDGQDASLNRDEFGQNVDLEGKADVVSIGLDNPTLWRQKLRPRKTGKMAKLDNLTLRRQKLRPRKTFQIPEEPKKESGPKHPKKEKKNVIIHSKDRKFACATCKRKFAFRCDLVGHNRMVHQKQRPFKCKQCGKSFGKKFNMERHTFNIHAGGNPLPCPHCFNYIRGNHELSRHIAALHLGIKYSCNQCDKSFSRRNRLNNHLKKVHV